MRTAKATALMALGWVLLLASVGVGASFDDSFGGFGGFGGGGGSLAGDAEGDINMKAFNLTFHTDNSAKLSSDASNTLRVSGLLTDDGTGPLVLGSTSSCTLFSGDVCIGNDMTVGDNIFTAGAISTFSAMQFTSGAFQGEVTYKEDNGLMLAPRPSNNRANGNVIFTFTTLTTESLSWASVPSLDPTTIWVSGNGPTAQPTEYAAARHNRTDFEIVTGKGDIHFNSVTDIVRQDPIACGSLPAAGTSGRIAVATGTTTTGTALCIDNGTAWRLADDSANCCP